MNHFDARRLTVCFIAGIVIAGLIIQLCWHGFLQNSFEDLAPTALVPPSDKYFLVYGRDIIDMHAVYHGRHGIADRLSKADVLIVGNSRVGFAFLRDTVDEFFRRCGLSYHVLSFGGEADLFPTAVIEKFDLRPKWVIVNLDRFFLDAMGTIGAAAVQSHPFEAWRREFELDTSHRARAQLHRWWPHMDLSSHAGRVDTIIYRSARKGYWFLAAGRGVPEPVNSREPVTPAPAARNFEAATRFQAMIEDRGGRMLLTYIPQTNRERPLAQQMAGHLNQGLISPELDGLMTYDGSHIDKASASRWMKSMLPELASQLGCAVPPETVSAWRK